MNEWVNGGIKSYQGEDCEFIQMSCFRWGYFAHRKGQNAASVKELGGPFVLLTSCLLFCGSQSRWPIPTFIYEFVFIRKCSSLFLLFVPSHIPRLRRKFKWGLVFLWKKNLISNLNHTQVKGDIRHFCGWVKGLESVSMRQMLHWYHQLLAWVWLCFPSFYCYSHFYDFSFHSDKIIIIICWKLIHLGFCVCGETKS